MHIVTIVYNHNTDELSILRKCTNLCQFLSVFIQVIKTSTSPLSA